MLLRRNIIEVISIFLLGCVAFTINLNHQEIIGFDSRFYLFAQEMLRHGFTWFPTTYQHPYPDYPAAGIVAVYWFAKFFGMLNKLTAVLPTAICAALTLVMTYLIGALHKKQWGLYAVFFLLLTLTFLRSARSISLDLYPTLFTATCFYLIYAADKKNQPRLSWLIYPLLFLSFVFRGPIGLVIPAGVIFSYYLLTKNFRNLFLIGFLALTLLCICTVLLLKLAQVTGGTTFLHEVLRMQIVGRIDNPYLPRDFYFINSLKMYALAYPIALLVLIGLAFSSEEAIDTKFIFLLLGWTLIILVGMTIPDDKKERYILEISPAIALMAAYPYFAPREEIYFCILRGFLNILFLLFPLLLLVSLLYLNYYATAKSYKLNIHYTAMFVLLGLFQIANVFIFFHRQISAIWRETFLLAIAAMCFVIINFAVVEVVELFLDNTREFVIATEAKRLQNHAQLVFYKEAPDGTAIKYLINMVHAEKPDFVPDEEGLLNYTKPAFFVTSSEYLSQMPKTLLKNFRIISRGKLGHVSVAVFERQR